MYFTFLVDEHIEKILLPDMWLFVTILSVLHVYAFGRSFFGIIIIFIVSPSHELDVIDVSYIELIFDRLNSYILERTRLVPLCELLPNEPAFRFLATFHADSPCVTAAL